MITTTRIEQDTLEQLRQLAKAHRRSMTQELAVIISETIVQHIEESPTTKTYSAKIKLDPKPTPLEGTSKALKENKLPKTFKATIKPQAKFGATKPIPKGKSK